MKQKRPGHLRRNNEKRALAIYIFICGPARCIIPQHTRYLVGVIIGIPEIRLLCTAYDRTSVTTVYSYRSKLKASL